MHLNHLMSALQAMKTQTQLTCFALCIMACALVPSRQLSAQTSTSTARSPAATNLLGNIPPQIELLNAPFTPYGVEMVSYFSGVPLGYGMKRTYTVRNRGDLPLVGLSVAFKNDFSGEFELDTTGTVQTLAHLETTSFSVTFWPKTPGFREPKLAISSTDLEVIPAVIYLVGSTIYQLELWRYHQFGTYENAGDAADNADPDKDGLVNSLEFALKLNPSSPSQTTAKLSQGEPGFIDFTYTRNWGALYDGQSFIVEWSDSLAIQRSHAGNAAPAGTAASSPTSGMPRSSAQPKLPK